MHDPLSLELDKTDLKNDKHESNIVIQRWKHAPIIGSILRHSNSCVDIIENLHAATSLSVFPPSCKIFQNCKSFFSNFGNKHLQGPSKRKVLKCYLSLELFVKLYLGFDAVPLKIKLQSGNL